MIVVSAINPFQGYNNLYEFIPRFIVLAIDYNPQYLQLCTSYYYCGLINLIILTV